MQQYPGADHGAPPLEALLELSRSATEDPLPKVLAKVAGAVRGIAGFASVVVNVYRPAWEDYEAVFVLNEGSGVEALLGTTIDGRALFARADQCLYVAKSTGRNRTVCTTA